MATVNFDGHSYLRFDLAKAQVEDAGEAIPLTPSDIDALPGIANAIDAIFDFFSDDFEVRPMLVGAEIRIYLLPTSGDVPGSSEVRERCDKMVDVLEKDTDKLHDNAQLHKPLPPNRVVAVKTCIPLFRALAAANEISPLRIELVHADGEKRALPMPESAELPTVRARELDTLKVTSKVKGLIRGDKGMPNELILDSGTHVVLPDKPPWTWIDVHFTLETPNWLDGKVARLPNSSKWTIAADTRLTPQLPLGLSQPSGHFSHPYRIFNMTPGPDQIVACPHCSGLAKYKTLLSGNNFGARIWTDGKQVAPMLPAPPPVVQCRHCARFYWLADAKDVGTISTGGSVDSSWLVAKEVQEPTEEEFYKAIDNGLAADSGQEKELRILAWQRRNDPFRQSTKQTEDASTITPMFNRNLQALARLLDNENEDDRLLKAELLRELGEFEPAKQVLSGVSSDRFATIVRQLRLLCDAGDAGVAELQF